MLHRVFVVWLQCQLATAITIITGERQLQPIENENIYLKKKGRNERTNGLINYCVLCQSSRCVRIAPHSICVCSTSRCRIEFNLKAKRIMFVCIIILVHMWEIPRPGAYATAESDTYFICHSFLGLASKNTKRTELKFHQETEFRWIIYHYDFPTKVNVSLRCVFR